MARLAWQYSASPLCVLYLPMIFYKLKVNPFPLEAVFGLLRASFLDLGDIDCVPQYPLVRRLYPNYVSPFYE